MWPRHIQTPGRTALSRTSGFLNCLGSPFEIHVSLKLKAAAERMGSLSMLICKRGARGPETLVRSG